MITVLKVQLPLNRDTNPFALAYNTKGTFRNLIDINENETLIDELFKEEKFCLISYCKCEVKGSKIVKVLEHVSDLEFLLGDDK